MVKYNKIINKGENEMLSAILIFLFVFCGSIIIHEKVAKKNNEKKTNIATTIVALVLVLGMFVLNVAVIGQGISEINDNDTYIMYDNNEKGFYKTKDDKYYHIKLNLWKFWDMYEKEYMSEEEVNTILEKEN